MSRRSFSKSERKSVYDKCGGHCAYCGREISMSEMQVDHLIPIHMEEAYKAWGRDLNDKGNLLPACASCNRYKDTYDLETFRQMLERQPAILERDRPTYRMAVRYGLVIPNEHHIKFYFEKMDKEDMSDQRLVDVSSITKCFRDDWNDEIFDADEVADVLDDCPTIDPETLPIVKELRAKIEKLNQGIESLSENIKYAYQERDELRAKLAECEPKHGHWIPMDSDGIDQIYRCSACGRIVLTHAYSSSMISEYPYCHCGAKMDGKV